MFVALFRWLQMLLRQRFSRMRPGSPGSLWRETVARQEAVAKAADISTVASSTGGTHTHSHEQGEGCDHDHDHGHDHGHIHGHGQPSPSAMSTASAEGDDPMKAVSQTSAPVLCDLNVVELKERLDAGHPTVVLDVREPDEWTIAKVERPEFVFVAMSDIARRRLEALPEALRDKNQPIAVMCHHGGRSAQVAGFLRSEGYTQVGNVLGGIHAWAEVVDQTVGFY